MKVFLQVLYVYFTMDTIMLSSLSILVIVLYSRMFRAIVKTKVNNPQSALIAEKLEIRLSIVGLFLSVCLFLITIRSILIKIHDQIFASDLGKAYAIIVFTMYDIANPYLLFACSKTLRQKFWSLVCFKSFKKNTVTPTSGPRLNGQRSCHVYRPT